MWKRLFRSDDTGSIAISTALMLPVVVGFVALGVDLGSVYLSQKRLQGATDLAALSAAADIDHADRTVRAVLSENGFSGAAYAIEFGRFSPDRTLPADQRFRAAATGTNALRVRASAATPIFFARIFQSSDVGLEAAAVAAVRTQASFSIASRLASLEGGVLNQILQQTLGAGVSLSVLDSSTLASASLDAGTLAGALQSLSPKATYGALLDQSIDVKLFLAALSNANRTAGNLNAASIANRLANQTVAGRFSLQPSRLIALPDLSAVEVGYPARALDLDLNVLDLLTAAVLSNAHKTAIKLDLTVPLLAGVSVEMLLGEAEQASIAAAPIGTRVSTAQLKTRISVDLLGNGPLAILGHIRLPIEVVAASGTAVLAGAECRGTARSATLDVTPGLAKIEIGEWGSQPLADASMARLPKPATLVSILGITATTRSVVQLADAAPTPVPFGTTEIGAAKKKTVQTRQFARSIARDLIGNLDDIDVQILGLPLIPKGIVKLNLLTQLTAIAVPLDTVLNTVLDLAGVRLGEADVRVGEIGCGGAAIVG